MERVLYCGRDGNPVSAVNLEKHLCDFSATLVGVDQTLTAIFFEHSLDDHLIYKLELLRSALRYLNTIAERLLPDLQATDCDPATAGCSGSDQ